MVIFFLLSQYKLKHAFILPQTQTSSTMTLHPWRMSCPGRITCFSAYFGPCPDCACQAAKWQLRAEEQLGKWHVASAWEARWARMQRGRDCGLCIAVQVPRAQGQPWMTLMVWSKTVNRSLMAANILYHLHQSQTDLALQQLLWKETLSSPSYVRYKMMHLK